MRDEVRAQVVELGHELMQLLHQAGIPLHEMSRRLGRHDQYLSRAFRGVTPLKLEIAFAILKALKVEPDHFFEDLYPFGGEGMAQIRRNPPPGYRPQEALRAQKRRLREERGERWTPKSLTAKAGRVLRGMLKRRRLRQAEVSRWLGFGPTALGQALRGYSAVSFEHVFGTLAACGAPPGRFVKELFGPPDKTLLGHLRWLRALDHAERLVTGMMSAYAVRRGLLPAAPPAISPPPLAEQTHKRARKKVEPAQSRRNATGKKRHGARQRRRA